MSNYSKVIICWTSIDREVSSSRQRAGEIIRKYLDREYGTFPFMVSGGAGDRDCLVNTMACEVVVVGSCNYFQPHVMHDILRSFKWERLGQVELLWKHEEMDNYMHILADTEPQSADEGE